MNDIAEICIKARDLILREGWTTGGGGWVGDAGWCIEGAIGEVTGLNKLYQNGAMSDAINGSEVGAAILSYLGLPLMVTLNSWNDRHATKELVLQVLAEVAAKYTEQEELVYEAPKLEEARILGPIVIPPMPEGEESEPIFRRLLAAFRS